MRNDFVINKIYNANIRFETDAGTFEVMALNPARCELSISNSWDIHEQKTLKVEMEDCTEVSFLPNSTTDDGIEDSIELEEFLDEFRKG